MMVVMEDLEDTLTKNNTWKDTVKYKVLDDLPHLSNWGDKA